MRKTLTLVIGIFLIFIAGVSFGIGLFPKEDKKKINEDLKYLKLYTEVFAIVKEHYVEPVDGKKLVYGSLKGMLQSLDPYSMFFTPEEFKEFTVESKGEFGGLGMEVTMEHGKLIVVAPIEDTPAWRAGIKPGDIILEINGEPTDNMSLIEAVKKMRGKPGTTITLTILRRGVNKPIKVKITRAIIKVKSVKTKELENGKYGYIRLTQFQENSDKEMRKALEKFKNKKGIVIDLRNNPGGLLTVAVNIADMFLDKGDLIVYTKGRDFRMNEKFYSRHNPIVNRNQKIVVLVNFGSASASEILTGSLQDNHKAVIVGDQTYGKASVQTLIPLRDGSGLKLTTAHYYTPSGRLIAKKGIIPDIVVHISKEEEMERLKQERDAKIKGENKVKVKDPQLDEAIKVLDYLTSG